MTANVIETAAQTLANAQYSFALTGAGISTPSGIPDFRTRTEGLWEQDDPMVVASFRSFLQHPLVFYQWIRPLLSQMVAAQPNPAHYALAQLETMGLLGGVITQNIDLLHSRAGSATVYEVHGHIRLMTCIQCFREYDAAPLVDELLEASEVRIPRCAVCNGVLKPNVILFGEQLPMPILQKAQAALKKTDVLLVAGSSLEVHPVADFPRRVKTQGGKVIIINRDVTDYDVIADIVIHDDVAEVLPALVRALEGTK